MMIIYGFWFFRLNGPICGSILFDCTYTHTQRHTCELFCAQPHSKLLPLTHRIHAHTHIHTPLTRSRTHILKPGTRRTQHKKEWIIPVGFRTHTHTMGTHNIVCDHYTRHNGKASRIVCAPEQMGNFPPTARTAATNSSAHAHVLQTHTY